MAHAEEAQQVQRQEWEEPEDSGADQLSACRGMLHGALRLLWWRHRETLGGTLPAVGTAHNAMLVPVRAARPDADIPVPEGTLPHRAVQLSSAAASRDLHLGFRWGGIAELSGLCLLLRADGTLLRAFWPGRPGGLRTDGVQVLPADETGSEDMGGFALRLRSVHPEAYACIFVLRAQEQEGRKKSASALFFVDEVHVRLSTGWHDPHFWRYTQHDPQEDGNTFVCAVLYRGPHDSWRVEPLNMKYMIRGFKDMDDLDAAYEDAAEALRWRLRWFPKDRRWQTVSEERSIKFKPLAPK